MSYKASSGRSLWSHGDGQTTRRRKGETFRLHDRSRTVKNNLRHLEQKKRKEGGQTLKTHAKDKRYKSKGKVLLLLERIGYGGCIQITWHISVTLRGKEQSRQGTGLPIIFSSGFVWMTEPLSSTAWILATFCHHCSGTRGNRLIKGVGHVYWGIFVVKK